MDNNKPLSEEEISKIVEMLEGFSDSLNKSDIIDVLRSEIDKNCDSVSDSSNPVLVVLARD